MARFYSSNYGGESLVNDAGQLYTIEGVSAAILMIVTAYIILNTSTLFTAGETHIIDLQLEQLGNDALSMMNMPDTVPSPIGFSSDLKTYIEEGNTMGFNTTFLSYINMKTNGQNDNLQYHATIYYQTAAGTDSVPFASSGQAMTGREHAITVSRLVLIDIPDPVNPPLDGTTLTPGEHHVMFEVSLWRS
jgi:hypothetical protein